MMKKESRNHFWFRPTLPVFGAHGWISRSRSPSSIMQYNPSSNINTFSSVQGSQYNIVNNFGTAYDNV